MASEVNDSAETNAFQLGIVSELMEDSGKNQLTKDDETLGLDDQTLVQLNDNQEVIADSTAGRIVSSNQIVDLGEQMIVEHQ